MDVIVAQAAPGTVASKNATTIIPIVMIAAYDLGYAPARREPRTSGKNVTGLSFSIGVETLGKWPTRGDRSEASPSRDSLEPGQFGPAAHDRGVKIAARSLGMQQQFPAARSPDEIDGAFAAMAKEGAEAVHSYRENVEVNRRFSRGPTDNV